MNLEAGAFEENLIKAIDCSRRIIRLKKPSIGSKVLHSPKIRFLHGNDPNDADAIDSLFSSPRSTAPKLSLSGSSGMADGERTAIPNSSARSERTRSKGKQRSFFADTTPSPERSFEQDGVTLIVMATNRLPSPLLVTGLSRTPSEREGDADRHDNRAAAVAVTLSPLTISSRGRRSLSPLTIPPRDEKETPPAAVVLDLVTGLSRQRRPSLRRPSLDGPGPMPTPLNEALTRRKSHSKCKSSDRSLLQRKSSDRSSLKRKDTSLDLRWATVVSDPELALCERGIEATRDKGRKKNSVHWVVCVTPPYSAGGWSGGEEDNASEGYVVLYPRRSCRLVDKALRQWLAKPGAIEQIPTARGNDSLLWRFSCIEMESIKVVVGTQKRKSGTSDAVVSVGVWTSKTNPPTLRSRKLVFRVAHEAQSWARGLRRILTTWKRAIVAAVVAEDAAEAKRLERIESELDLNAWWIVHGIAVGDAVAHPTRGEGVVVAINVDHDEKIHVAFKSAVETETQGEGGSGSGAEVHRYKRGSWGKFTHESSAWWVRRWS